MGRFFHRDRGSADEHVPAAFPDEWRVLLARWLRWWRWLDDAERAQLEQLMLAFIDDMRWEPAQGFRISDEIQLLVAANACLLVLGFAPELDAGVQPYGRVSSIIVHRSTVVLDGQRSAGADGVVASGRYALHGQATHRGPVVLSWGAVTSDLRRPHGGRNVVLHEFAHQLDMIDGVVDGTPPLGDERSTQRWHAVRDHEFKALRAGRAHPVLDEYAATNHAEFFAVTSELLFTRPVEMQAALPELYAALSALYRQDPAGRIAQLTAAARAGVIPSAT